MTTIDVLFAIPESTSRVPRLCSVHATEGRGEFGNPRFRGNFSGLLICDLLEFFRPRTLLDPMQGSGTAGDVAKSLGVLLQGFDLATGFDATNPQSFDGLAPVDMVWLYPPYFDLIKYNDDDLCLSRSETLDTFCEQLQSVLRNCRNVLTEHGHIAILIGDATRRGRNHALPFRTWSMANALGLELLVPKSFASVKCRNSFSSSGVIVAPNLGFNK